MRDRIRIAARLSLLFAVLALPASTAPAVEPEDGPMYLTDSHGASGVVYCMLSMADVDPKYLDCAEQTLKWLMHVAKRDEKGRIAWYLSESAPKGHKNRRLQLPGMPLAAVLFLSAYEKTKRPEYKDTGLAAARWLADVGADKWGTDLGIAYGWGWAFGQKGRVLVPGHSHGLGKYLQLMLQARSLEPDHTFDKALDGILIHLKTNAVSMDGGACAWRSFQWKHVKDKGAILTGYCFGQAGVIIPLLETAMAMPDHKLSDGTTALALGNGGLRYLIRRAKPAMGGYVWPYMRFDKRSKNSGLGSGTGGIGLAFLRGYQANRKHGDKAFAAECLKYAKGAAEYALARIERAPEDTRFVGGGGSGGFGVCGGAGGTAYFPMILAKALGDPGYAERVKKAAKRISGFLIASGTPVGDMLAWPLTGGERKRHKVREDVRTVNMALDYGQTGVVLALAEMGKYTQDKQVLAGARKAADFVIHHAVKTDHGWKLARFVRIDAQP